MEYPSAIKKRNSAIDNKMDLEGIMLSEISDKERQTLYVSTYMSNLKNKTN